MEAALEFAVVIGVAYLFGAVPWGIVVGRLFGGVDIREYGSGNIGFTNVLRVVGVVPGIITGVLDFSKGILPVLLPRLVSDDPWLQAAGAGAAVIGHTWPVFLGFRGGKGVATGMGAALAMGPLQVLAIAAIGLPLLAKVRYVSLMVLIFAPLLALMMIGLAIADLTSPAYATFVAAATALIYVRHRENIARLRAGTEAKIGQRVEVVSERA